MSKKKIKNYLGRNFNKKRQPDKINKKRRSLVMSKIRSKNTRFEQDFAKELRTRTKKRFQTNVKNILGKPDIVFKKYKICIFLDSDFWHGWQYSRWKHLLKNDFWRTKIEKNRARDKATTNKLRRRGWKVFRFWEHQLKTDIGKVLKEIISQLKGG